METLLRIDASIRKQGSFSRTAGDFFQSQWSLQNPNGKIIHRDLADENIPHITQQMTEAFYSQGGPPEILSLSDEIVEEVKVCNTLLITSALYNYAVPSNLKSYLDHLVRINKTFSPSADGGYSGLLHGKHAIVITSKGGVYKGTNSERLDHQDPYLKTILNFIGIQDIEMFSIEGTKDTKYAENMILTIKSKITAFFNKADKPIIVDA
jgi:FMN-dependent NADH-azoreductase